MSKLKLLASAATIVVGALAFGTHPAFADIVFQTGNHPQANEQNILFEASELGTSLDNGEVDHSGAAVSFDSLTNQLLNQQAKGQADIFCALNCTNNGGNESSQLNSIEMKAGKDANGILTAWTDAIINLDFGIGTAHVVATDNLGGTFNFDLKNGENFLTMVVVPGTNEFITDIRVTGVGTPFGFNSFKQPRVSGVCELVSATSCSPIETPEPASLGLLGLGLLGTVAFSIRKRQG
jgi:hypothetical protein